MSDARSTQRTNGAFAPAWWARAAWAQTLLAGWVGRAERAPVVERVELPDGDFVELHRWPVANGAPLVLVLHGLEGSARSTYVGEVVRRARGLGFAVASLEFRSCSAEPNRRLRSYHSGETSDLAFVVERLVREDAQRPWFAAGWSLGANVLLKWLGEVGANAPRTLRAAAAVSTPFDLEIAARACDARYGGAIARHFLKTLVPKAVAKARAFPGVLDERAVRACRTFAAFDDLVTAPVHGFRDARDYWQRSSSKHFVARIEKPVLLVSAQDDPLVPREAWPGEAIASNANLQTEWLPHGGHCGFVEGAPWRPVRWAEGRVLRFFTEQLAARAKNDDL